jgi:hypothetical protein
VPNFYDTDRAVAEYLLFHYAPPEVQMPWALGPREGVDFPVRCVTETFDTHSVPSDPPRDPGAGPGLRGGTIHVRVVPVLR